MITHIDRECALLGHEWACDHENDPPTCRHCGAMGISRNAVDVAGYGTATHRATPGEPDLVTIEIRDILDRPLTFTITPINPDYQPEPQDDPQEPEA